MPQRLVDDTEKICTRLRLNAAPKVVISFYCPSPHLKEEVAV